MNLAISIEATLREASIEASVWDPISDKERLFHSNFGRPPIAVCAPSNKTEIAFALDIAHKNKIPVSVCCAGHHISGRALAEDGLVISLEKFKQFKFCEDRKIVVVGAGITWGEFDNLCKPFKVGTTGGIVSYTGVSGLALTCSPLSDHPAGDFPGV